MKTLRLILGDQLNLNHSRFKKADNSKLYVLIKNRQETNYVKHHIQKIMTFFAAIQEYSGFLENRDIGFFIKKLMLLAIPIPHVKSTAASTRQETQDNPAIPAPIMIT